MTRLRSRLGRATWSVMQWLVSSMNSTLARSLLTVAFVLGPAGHAQSQGAVEQPFAIAIEGNNVVLRNTGDRYLEIKLAIEGNNFVAQFACEVSVYLPSNAKHTLSVQPKNKAIPANYKILVREFSARTLEQLRSELGGKLPPAPTSVPPNDVARMSPLTCESH